MHFPSPREIIAPHKQTDYTLGGWFSCAVLRTYLHSDLRQVHLQRQLLSAVHVRVMGLFKRPLQFVELESGERRPVPTVFLLGVLVVRQFAVSVRGVRTHRRFGGAAGATSTCAHGEESERLANSANGMLFVVSGGGRVKWQCVF